MNPHTGDLDTELARLAQLMKSQGYNPKDMVLLTGPEAQVRNVSEAVKSARRAENKRARQSRKRNR